MDVFGLLYQHHQILLARICQLSVCQLRQKLSFGVLWSVWRVCRKFSGLLFLVYGFLYQFEQVLVWDVVDYGEKGKCQCWAVGWRDCWRCCVAYCDHRADSMVEEEKGGWGYRAEHSYVQYNGRPWNNDRNDKPHPTSVRYGPTPTAEPTSLHATFPTRLPAAIPTTPTKLFSQPVRRPNPTTGSLSQPNVLILLNIFFLWNNVVFIFTTN